jgi:outer membrane receptor for Fe3+-dicitrate
MRTRPTSTTASRWAWRITPGVRYERSRRRATTWRQSTFETDNNKALPSLNVAYLLNRALTVFANYTTSFGAVQNTSSIRRRQQSAEAGTGQDRRTGRALERRR